MLISHGDLEELIVEFEQRAAVAQLAGDLASRLVYRHCARITREKLRPHLETLGRVEVARSSLAGRWQ